MAFLCSQLQVAVETQSQTRSSWNTDWRRCRLLLPPPGHAGQNRAIVQDRTGPTNAPRPLRLTDRPPLQPFHYTEIFKDSRIQGNMTEKQDSASVFDPPVTDAVSEKARDTSSVEICQIRGSGTRAQAHAQKRSTGNASRGLLVLEMRNVIHFLSKVGQLCHEQEG